MQRAPGIVRSWGLVLLGGVAWGVARDAVAFDVPVAVVDPGSGVRVDLGPEAASLEGAPSGGASSTSFAMPSRSMLLGLMSIPSQSTTQAAPRFAYRSGPQGVGYYASPAPGATAPRPRPAASGRPRTVGPGARNWATGNRVPLHRPWMRARH